MNHDDPLWGAPRIHGELLKRITVSGTNADDRVQQRRGAEAVYELNRALPQERKRRGAAEVSAARRSSTMSVH